jgi:hypothetical protein
LGAVIITSISVITKKMNIHSSQELGKSPIVGDMTSELEALGRLMEDNPEMQLTERTKKLRQACFKASYKKRRGRLTYYLPRF